jgi:hypothetical protein
MQHIAKSSPTFSAQFLCLAARTWSIQKCPPGHCLWKTLSNPDLNPVPDSSSKTCEKCRLIAFRDLLRSRPDLVAAYIARKREILASGIIDPVDYSEAKGPFVRGVLGRRVAPAS